MSELESWYESEAERKWVKRKIGELFHQSLLIEALLKNGFISYDDIQNYPDSEDGVEIFQWFIIDKWDAMNLIKIGEIVIDNEYGYWWGRTTYGQAIEMDGTFQKLFRDIWSELKK